MLQKPSNSVVLNLRSQTQNKDDRSVVRPVSSPDVDTSTANYSEIFLQEQGGQPEEEKVFFSPLPRSKQLAAVRGSSQLNGIIDSAPTQTPSSAALQAMVENHDPDTKYPSGYFSIPPLPQRTTEDEPEADDPDAAYMSRLQQRDGFFLQPDTVTVDDLVVLLRTGCNQIVEINRKQLRNEHGTGTSSVPPSPRGAGAVYMPAPVSADGVVTVHGTHTFISAELTPSGAVALERYLVLHGRSSKYLRCGVYGCASAAEAQSITLAAIAIKTDSGGIFVTLSCTAAARGSSPQAARRRVVCFAPRGGVVLDLVLDLVPAPPSRQAAGPRPAREGEPPRRAPHMAHNAGPECCSIS